MTEGITWIKYQVPVLGGLPTRIGPTHCKDICKDGVVKVKFQWGRGKSPYRDLGLVRCRACEYYTNAGRYNRCPCCNNKFKTRPTSKK